MLEEQATKRIRTDEPNNPLDAKCGEIPFSEVCKMLESVEKITGERSSERKFECIFTKSRVKHFEGHSLFPFLRLLLPQEDSERGRYGLKETLVAKTYIDALNLNQETSADAQRLLYWKDPSKQTKFDPNAASVQRDFGAILEDVLSSRVTTQMSEVKVAEVNEVLNRLASSPGEAKLVIIRDQILKTFSAKEQVLRTRKSRRNYEFEFHNLNCFSL